MLEHNTNHHILTRRIEGHPEAPIGLEVAWNTYENGYTGEIEFWFSKESVENNPAWQKVKK